MRFDLDALSEPAPLQQISLDAIDEDPAQPRQEFEPVALSELADTIRERGVLQPVSVRRHATQPARYVLNFGARRLRASRLASRTSIPAFIDELATSYDQVVENEQREGLTPLELALFVQRRLNVGDSQAEIARRLGKSRSYVTYATALIDAPDWLLTLYRDGRCRGLLELYELRQLHVCCPHIVRTLESSGEPITRRRIAAAKTDLAVAPSFPARAAHGSLANDESKAEQATTARQIDAVASDPGARAVIASASKNGNSTYVLLAELDGRTIEVVVDDAPPADGTVYMRTPGESGRRAVPAGDLRLIRIAARSSR